MTYQNDTTLIICEDCQRERVDALIKGIGEAYFAQFEKDMLAATSEEAHIDD